MAGRNQFAVLELVKRIKTELPNKRIWLYTGDVFENLTNNPITMDILKNIDVLVDGEYKDELRDISYKTVRYAGSTNQRVINVPETLKTGKIAWEESAIVRK